MLAPNRYQRSATRQITATGLIQSHRVRTLVIIVIIDIILIGCEISCTPCITPALELGLLGSADHATKDIKIRKLVVRICLWSLTAPALEPIT